MWIIFILLGLLGVDGLVAQTMTIAVGTGIPGYSGDGGPATLAEIGLPRSVFVDRDGNLFVSDAQNHVVRKVDTSTGIIETVAGDGFRADVLTGRYTGDGGPATEASLSTPEGIFVDLLGNLYIAERRNDRIRRVDGSDGRISTIAGVGVEGFSGDGGPATLAALHDPTGVWLDRVGNIFIADLGNQRIRRVDAASGTIETVAGSGEAGYSGDGGPSSEATFRGPIAVFVDRAGSIYINDTGNVRVRKVDVSGRIQTIVGGQSALGEALGLDPRGFSGDGGSATDARTAGGKDIFIDAAGVLYLADEDNDRVRRVGTDGIITTAAGGGFRGPFVPPGPATEAWLTDPKGVYVDGSGNLYIADEDNHMVRVATGVGAPTIIESFPLTALDYDGDLRIGFGDFLVFATRFAMPSDDRDDRFDYNGDDRVGLADLVFFSEAFGTLLAVSIELGSP